MLHTVNKSPYGSDSLKTCLTYAKSNDVVLLIEDGVYAAMNNSISQKLFNEGPEGIKICALGPDLKARGIVDNKLAEGIEVVGFDGFVRLAVDNDKVQSWL